MGPWVDERLIEWVLFLFISIFLYVQVCAAVSFYIYNLFNLIGKVKNLLNLYVEFFYKK